MGHVALGVTLVRAAWAWWLLAVFYLVVVGAVRLTKRFVLLSVSIALALLAFLPSSNVILDRLTSTASDAQSDTSFRFRFGQYGELLPGLVRDVVGQGLGSAGSAGRSLNDTVGGFRDLDSTYLEAFRSFGVILGGLVIAVTIAAIIGSSPRTHRLMGPYAALATVWLVMFLGNYLTSAVGVLVAVTLASCLLQSDEQPAVESAST